MNLTLNGSSFLLLLSYITSLLLISTPFTSAKPSNITFFPPLSPRSLSPRAPLPPPHRIVIRHYTLDITSGTIFQSCDPFSSTPLINSTTPGPTLRARAGEILQVRVYNSLPTSSSSDTNLTMHFHGLSMKMHPVMDGTTMISQWPIKPGKFFDYRIGLTEEDKGTYFYHSHVGVQAMTAYGVLIVEDPITTDFYDPNSVDEGSVGDVEYIHVYGSEGLDPNGRAGVKSPYKYHEDRILAISDYFSYSSPERIVFQLESDPFIWPGSATKLLLNGVSSASNVSTLVEPECNQTKASLINTSCNSAPSDCTTAKDYPTIEVDYDKTYRLRFIGATSLMYVSLGILKQGGRGELEKMTLIEADGTYLDPLEVDRVELTSGQRYSTLYHSKSHQEVNKDASGGVYWIRAESKWRSGPSMWVKLLYPTPSSSPSPSYSLRDKVASQPPAKFDPVTKKELEILPKETFAWVASQFSPLSTPGGPKWWYPPPMPSDTQVTRTVVIDTQQVKFLPSGKGVNWAENGQLFNETLPSPSNPTPYLVRTFLGDINFPNPDQLLSNPKFNPTTYSISPINSTVQNLIEGGKEEEHAAKDRKWNQGYDKGLNMYFAEEGEVIDIVLINKPSQLSSSVEIHPWHMHSHKHWTRTIQPGTFSFSRLSSLNSPSSASSGWETPIQRDTTIVYASPGAAYANQTVSNPSTSDGGFAVLRYKVDGKNAGVFLLHCHLAFHLQMGMASVWTMAPSRLLDKAGGYWPKQVEVKGGGGGKEGSEESIESLDEGYFKYGSSVTAL